MTFVTWDADEPEGSIGDRFARVVSSVPDRPAVSDGRTLLTYEEFGSRVNGIARALLDRLGPGEEPVAVYGELEVELIAALMGVVVAGKAYVPIDVSYPSDRVHGMLADAGCRAVVTTHGRAESAIDRLGANLHVIDAGTVDQTPESPAVPAGGGSMLNIIYTSGSTGRPKGVVQVHRNMLNDSALAQGTYGIGVDDRFGLIVPITFGASASDVLGALLNGASLHLFDLKVTELGALGRWMREERISLTHAVPTVFRRWMSVLREGDTYPAMRVVKIGGEPLLRTDVESFSAHFPPGCLLRNALGTTETYTVAVETLRPGDQVDSAVVPVGFPVAGRTIAILDDEGRPVAAGAIGQIAVTSRYLSPGYWRNEEATARSFLPALDGSNTYLMGDLGRVRPDGRLEHLGRMDDMVKIRGQRVEPGEVEAAMLEVPGVVEAAVAVRPHTDGSLRLVGYFVADGQVPATSQMRVLLRRHLPVHMIPSTFVPMDRLPVLPFGKVDRLALPEPGQIGLEEVEPIPPRNALEEAVASVVMNVLGLETLGVEDDLFAHGLDSLLATQLTARLRDAMGVELPIDTVFESPTVGALAASLGPSGATFESILEEIEALDDEQVRHLLADGG